MIIDIFFTSQGMHEAILKKLSHTERREKSIIANMNEQWSNEAAKYAIDKFQRSTTLQVLQSKWSYIFLFIYIISKI